MGAAGTQYRVYVTPLYSAFVYASEIEISDYVKDIAGTITKTIDSTDFSVGEYVYNDVQITCDNADGKLSDSSDSRTVFPFSRDKAKVRIAYDDGTGSPVTSYHGIINDAATTVQPETDELVFTILGPDSILTNSNIPAGTVTDGMTVTQALVAILNTADVRSTLGVSLSNLNPQNDITIDDGTKFDNLNKKDAITELLGASNSVLVIDSSLNVIVRDRTANSGNPVTYLYGKGDPNGKNENIASIQDYNTGLQRVFNSVLVTGGQPSVSVDAAAGGTVNVAQNAPVGSANDLTSQNLYGLRQKQISFEWITNQTTLDSVAQSYVDEFSYPKIEFQVVVPTADVISADLLDEVSVSYPLFVTPTGKFLPVIGVTKIGDVNSPLPNVKGAVSIDASLDFKIIEKTEDISTLQTTMKLRQKGVSLTDGTF